MANIYCVYLYEWPIKKQIYDWQTNKKKIQSGQQLFLIRVANMFLIRVANMFFRIALQTCLTDCWREGRAMDRQDRQRLPGEKTTF